MRLHPAFCPSLLSDESPVSYWSRVAFGIGRTARDAARDAGFRFQSIVEGDAEELGLLTATCGMATSAFDGTALVLAGEKTFTLAGEEFPQTHLTRARLYVCPCCLREEGPHGKARWQLEAMRVCLRHNCMLVPLYDEYRQHETNDIARLIHGRRELLRDLEAAPIPHGSSNLAEHLNRRLDGVEPEGRLSGMPAFAAARFCEMVGLARIKGVHALWRETSDMDRHLSGAEGYAVLSAGADALRDHFREVRRSAPVEEFGLLKVYGRLYEFLSHEHVGPAYEPVRSVFRDHLLETAAFGSGDIVLGKRIETRHLHSVRSIGVETGMDVRVVRRRMIALGLIDDTVADLPNDRVLIDAEKHADLVRLMPEMMVRCDAERYLKVHRQQSYMLDPTLITPVGPYGESIEHVFTRDDLDAYFVKLTAGAKPLASSESGYYPIGITAIRCKCEPLEVMTLLADSRLADIRIDTRELGMRSIRLNPLEVRHHLGRLHKLMSARTVAVEIGCTQPIADALLTSNILPSNVVVHPSNGVKVRMTTRDHFDDFTARYISVHRIAVDIGRHHRNVSRLLREMKVEPAFDPKTTRTQFFERSKIAQTLERLQA
jgi:hypothetical protein